MKIIEEEKMNIKKKRLKNGIKMMK